MVSSLERLLAIEDIKRLRYRFCHVLDARDWSGVESLMTEGVTFRFTDESGAGLLGQDGPIRLESRQATVGFMKQFVGPSASVHIGGMAEIDVHSAVSAHGRWAMQGFTEGGGALGLAVGMGLEVIEEDYVQVDGRWLISSIDARIKAVK